LRAKLPITIERSRVPRQVLHPFTDYFKGFENVGAVRAVFGSETESVLRKLRLAFVSNRRMYMGIRDQDGNIGVGAFHLENSDQRTLYLDVVHELFHVKQFMDNKKWFREEHQKFMGDRGLYYASPLEVPAYYHTVKEAKRIGMSEKQIVQYLKMGPAPPKVFAKFLESMEISKDTSQKRINVSRFGITINRRPPIALYPFNDFFRDFAALPSVRALFGARTEQVLGKLRIEFVDFFFDSILPSDYGDNHLVASRDYVKRGKDISLYLDVILSLNILKRSTKQLVSSGAFYDFGSSPQILESYKAMIGEGKRLGVSNREILKHLILPRFVMSPKAYEKFVKNLEVPVPKLPGQQTRTIRSARAK
jgi:hypothetical protein